MCSLIRYSNLSQETAVALSSAPAPTDPTGGTWPELSRTDSAAPDQESWVSTPEFSSTWTGSASKHLILASRFHAGQASANVTGFRPRVSVSLLTSQIWLQCLLSSVGRSVDKGSLEFLVEELIVACLRMVEWIFFLLDLP